MKHFFVSSLVRTLHFFSSLRYDLRLAALREARLEEFIAENGLTERFTVDALAAASHRAYKEWLRSNLFILFGAMFRDGRSFAQYRDLAELRHAERLEPYRSRGCLALTYHVGPYTLAPVILSVMGFKVSILARSDEIGAKSGLTMERVNEGLARHAAACGFGRITLIDTFSKLALVQIKKVAKRGEIIYLYPDTVKDSSAESLPVPFFRQRFAGHVGLAKLVKLTGAEVLPVSIGWREGGGLALEIREPMVFAAAAGEREIVERLYSGFAAEVEARPAQWLQVESYRELKA